MEWVNGYASLAGFFFSLLILWSGVGAGVLVIPALITLFSIDPLTAVASGSAFAFLSKIGMTLGHAKHGGVNWHSAYQFLKICLPVTVVTSGLMAYLSHQGLGATLELALVIAILAAGGLALVALLSERTKTLIARWPLATLSSSTGLLMGLTGVGGGVMVVPALATSGGLSIKAAVATSIPVGLILSLAVSLTLGSSGFMDYVLVTSMLIGAAIGIPIGTRLFHLFSDQLIKHITCGLIAIALLDLLHQAWQLLHNAPSA